jgi:hypothetical protein
MASGISQLAGDGRLAGAFEFQKRPQFLINF